MDRALKQATCLPVCLPFCALTCSRAGLVCFFGFANRSRAPKIPLHAHSATELKMKTVVIAIGGNSLIKDAQHMSVPDQYAAVVETARHITDLLEQRYRIVITHGNGPQVGFILLRSEHSRGILHQVPLDSIVADTQGALGYQIQQALENEFRRRGLKTSVATVITQTLVDRNDPAFAKPSKPIGQFYTREEAEDRMRVEKWAMVEDAGRGSSPRPNPFASSNPRSSDTSSRTAIWSSQPAAVVFRWWRTKRAT
jgi:hypothetical protein